MPRLATKPPTTDWGVPTRIRADSHKKVRSIARIHRVPLSDAVALAATAWTLLTADQQNKLLSDLLATKHALE